MKNHSIQYKFLATVISAILAITFFIGGISIYEVDRFVQTHTEDYIAVSCEKEAAQVNNIFGDMEKSVRIMENYVLDLIESKEDIENKDKQNELVAKTDIMFGEVARNTDDTIAYYLRFNPEITDSKAGIFYSKMNGGDEYVSLEPTDLSTYDKKDMGHVGWFWQAYNEQKPVWMMPYYNQNNNVLMISYVIPLYCEDECLGVVGMDFDYTVLTEKVHEISIYENGFAHLEYNGEIVHSDKHIAGDEVLVSSDKYLRVSEELVNGMTLVLSADYSDIRQIRYDIAFKILVVVLLLVAIFSFVVFFVVRRIVGPLKELTEASKKLSAGIYNLETVQSDTYEIKMLSSAFESMTASLREHEKRQHLLAYRDPLTGLRNATSYKHWVNEFNKEIQGKNAEFGVMVLDVNYLKDTNDKYGHDMGNKLLVTAARIISDIFKRSPVFRIGGDEFLVILQNRDLNECEVLFEKFDKACAETSVETDGANIPVRVAKGFSIYNPEGDTQFVDVFNRADEAMYIDKRDMKAKMIQ